MDTLTHGAYDAGTPVMQVHRTGVILWTRARIYETN